ncbi:MULTISPECIES: hypothetical protein [unclassified Sinorhizobium]|uniref:hypothetical protein n=1 Tax=unclassified Sinorhizobium TaxID=2613772 RepID=UPI0024C2917B|nr:MULTISPECIES: hypothetical protein [unclassified Sinorhizobium]MDK1377393.1 hypothetical protein [Sinorhizobium sp. 6-70]MDK1478883.1 hypothetical protein [Sinorhizobium sp. 6-117]
MTHAEEVMNRAMAVVDASRVRREREEERRRLIFGRIQLTPPLPALKRGGTQLSLNLDS